MSLYFLSLLPPDDLGDQIRALKEEISIKYNTNRALRLPAHLTLLAPFRLKETQLPELRRKLKTFCASQSSIHVEINGFGAFRPKVIFLEIANPGELRILQKNLQDYFEGLLPEEKNSRKFHPHITLATRDIHRSDFKKAWNELSPQNFHAEFEAKEIYLFSHNGKRWDISEVYPFSAQ